MIRREPASQLLSFRKANERLMAVRLAQLVTPASAAQEFHVPLFEFGFIDAARMPNRQA